ncbi:MAG: (Fe-S)-binding protein [Candidatus Obscuribacterales bacterium]|nr:(Fe-S)-binding protein [Candidatus Obscuribacterales bacterium]
MTVEKEKAAAISLIDEKLLQSCIHCGLCLPACPTYLATGRETESPRGRIYLLSLLAKGQIEPDKRAAEHINSCLGCMGCQTACPSGVDYEKILDQARPFFSKRQDRRKRRLMRLAFSQILPNYKRLHMLGKLLRLWQQSRMNRFVPLVPLPAKLKKRLIDWEKFLPPVPEFTPLPKQSWQSGKKDGEIQLFSGCVMDIFYNQVNHASIRLLTKQRQIVSVPEQTCCGALAQHSGESDIAKDLAKKNIELFENLKGDIVVTSAGCGAMLKNYGELLHDDPEWKERAEEFSHRVKDITEALDSGTFSQAPAPLEGKIAYHAACHLSHVQKVREAPVRLLNSIAGLELVPLQEPEHCCGSAGIYNLLETEMSLQVLERKINFIKESTATAVVTTNPGCLLQLQSGIDAQELPIKVYHLVELLDKAYTKE